MINIVTYNNDGTVQQCMSFSDDAANSEAVAKTLSGVYYGFAGEQTLSIGRWGAKAQAIVIANWANGSAAPFSE